MKCRIRVWIRDALPRGGTGESRKLSELTSPSVSDGCSQIFLEITEKEKRGFRCKFFTHEKHRGRRSKQQYRHSRANGTWISNLRDSFPESPVPHLIMILKKRYERSWRQTLCVFSPRFTIPVTGRFTLVSKAFSQATPELSQR